MNFLVGLFVIGYSASLASAAAIVESEVSSVSSASSASSASNYPSQNYADESSSDESFVEPSYFPLTGGYLVGSVNVNQGLGKYSIIFSLRIYPNSTFKFLLILRKRSLRTESVDRRTGELRQQ